MHDTEVPAWMLEQNEYVPETDHDGFITKSILKLLSLLTAVRDNAGAEEKGTGAAMKLITLLALIVLTGISRNMFFTYCLIAGFLVRLLFVPGKLLIRILKNALSVTILSMVILIFAAFFGSPRTLLTVSLKVFLSAGLISLMSCTTPWNRITEALKVFHVPDILIFILDITIKYIALLGEICFYSLTALKLRSVGKNRHKRHAFSGITGVTFLRSRKMADELFEAMICRGFEGTYIKRNSVLFGRRDIPALLFLLAAAALFVFTQLNITKHL